MYRDKHFGWRWVLLSAAGMVLGMMVGLFSSAPIEIAVGMMLVTPIIFGLAGLILGTGQWLAIKKFSKTGVLWMLTTAIGFAIGMSAGLVLVESVGRAITGEPMRIFNLGPIGHLYGLGTIGLITGAAVGGAQYIVLRKRIAVRPRWIVVCIAAFGLAFPISALAVDFVFGGLDGGIAFVIFLTLFGFFTGLFTCWEAKEMAASAI